MNGYSADSVTGLNGRIDKLNKTLTNEIELRELECLLKMFELKLITRDDLNESPRYIDSVTKLLKNGSKHNF